MISMCQYNEHWWTEICKKVKKAVVFIDDPSAECLHWNGGLLRLKDAAAVKEFSSFESGSEKQKKAVFLVSGPMVGLAADIINDIIRDSSFDYCVVITSASASVHKNAKYPGRDIDDNRVFAELEEQVLECMGNHNYTCEIFHFPFHSITPCPEVFVMPPFSRLFPPLTVDLARAAELFTMRSNAATLPPQPAVNAADAAISLVTMPYELQVSVCHFVASLHSTFQMLNIKEDIFTVGSFSRLLGEQLEVLPSARSRRKTAANRVSLLLVDRTLDLAGPTSGKFETVLDRVKAALESFPGHINDVQVDMAPLFGFSFSSKVTAREEFPAGCLAKSRSEDESDGLSPFVMGEDEGEVLRKLCADLHRASESSPEKELTKEVKVEDVARALEAFHLKEELIKKNIDLVQRARAVVTSSAAGSPSKALRQIQEMQNKFAKHLSGSKMKEVKGFLVHVTKLVRLRNDKGLGLQELLLLVVHLYSLLPPGEEFYPEDEDRLQSALSEAIVKDANKLGPVLRKMTKDAPVDEILAFEMVKIIFQKLNSLRKVREALNSYQSLVKDGSYSGFLSQLVDDVFADDRRNVPDLVHRAGGLGGLIKSGIGLFGVSVSKMHPRENPCLWIFVVGGITAKEVRDVRNLVASKSQCQLVIGSTKLLSTTETLLSLFGQDSLLTD